MRFVKTLTVTAGSTIASPSTDTLRLIKGTLTWIEVAFPPGPAGYVDVVIMDRNLQIAPANPEQVFSWDDYTFGFSMNYPIDDPPFILTLTGWSPDAKYDHNITFHFDVTPVGKDDRNALLDYFAILVALPMR